MKKTPILGKNVEKVEKGAFQILNKFMIGLNEVFHLALNHKYETSSYKNMFCEAI